MSAEKTLHLHLKSGERLFINGAALRVDRRVSIELLNDATFLLGSHVMASDAATTPLRQLYYMIQLLLTDPANTARIAPLVDSALDTVATTYEGEHFAGALAEVEARLAIKRYFDAMKMLRAMFDAEDNSLATAPASRPLRGGVNHPARTRRARARSLSKTG